MIWMGKFVIVSCRRETVAGWLKPTPLAKDCNLSGMFKAVFRVIFF